MKTITSRNYPNTPTSIIDTYLFYRFFGKFSSFKHAFRVFEYVIDIFTTLTLLWI